MDVVFENDERWNGARDVVTFWADAGEDRFRCVVSREAIRASFGGSGSDEDSISLFRTNRAVFEAEAAALIRSDRSVVVPSEFFREVQILSSRTKRLAAGRPMRRVTADEWAGSGIEAQTADRNWWKTAAGNQAEKIVICSAPSGPLYVDVSFLSESGASDFDHKMSTFGIRTFRLVTDAGKEPGGDQ